MIGRRGFLGGIIAAGIAPLIVRKASILMPINPVLVERPLPPGWPTKIGVMNYRNKMVAVMEYASGEMLRANDASKLLLPARLMPSIGQVKAMSGRAAFENGVFISPTMLLSPITKTERDLAPEDGRKCPITYEDFSKEPWHNGRHNAVYLPTTYADENDPDYEDETVRG